MTEEPKEERPQKSNTVEDCGLKFICHKCEQRKRIGEILAIQNDGPICKKCAGYS
jgi:hypothetical protein